MFLLSFVFALRPIGTTYDDIFTTNLHFIFFKWLFLISCASKTIRSQVVFLFLEAQINKYKDETPSPSSSSSHAILQHSDVLLMLLSNELFPELGFFCAPRVSRSNSAAASDLTAALSVKRLIGNSAHLVSYLSDLQSSFGPATLFGVVPGDLVCPVFLLSKELKKLAKTPSECVLPPGPTPGSVVCKRNYKMLKLGN